MYYLIKTMYKLFNACHKKTHAFAQVNGTLSRNNAAERYGYFVYLAHSS